TTYVVKEGDILGKIAEEHGCRVSDLVRWNPGMNPDQIHVGQKILIRSSTARSASTKGASGSPGEYTVVSGDTMMGIAAKLGVSYNALLAANRNINPDQIHIGQRLRVPTGSASAGVASGRVHEVVAGDTLSAI